MIAVKLECWNTGKCTTLDREDLERVLSHNSRWRDFKGYVVGWSRVLKKNVFLHRVVLDYYGELEVDHVNGDRMDNRKENLRIVTSSDNRFLGNKKANLRGSSTVPGVNFHKNRKKWSVNMRVNGKMIYGGSFDTEGEAICVANQMRERYRPGLAAEVNGEHNCYDFSCDGINYE